ncbi:hypothetical protein [Sphingomonas sp. GM_Shp_1]|uniref:hypothetical protein n=1 Tax=Sphingomonas sp. GM_Shp_1 TaxID=2937381 RepID=UPI00226B3966|nr:hypothetical protein [Sphingomonas sp. GM_Shp_1]
MQKVDLLLQIHLQDNPNATAAVYPWMEVLIPSVDAILAEMIGENLGLLEGVTGGASKHPIAFTAKRAHNSRWFIYQPDSVPDAINDIKNLIDRWTMPLLKECFSAEVFVAADQREDGRLARDRAQGMRVAAAALVSQRKDYAQAMMERWLGSPGTRRRYQQVYEYIQQAV